MPVCLCGGRGKAGYTREETFDLIILDIMLPNHGYELMEYIRPMNIPVIF